MLPQDDNILFSYINMGLRDKYEDLQDMASCEGFEADEVESRLREAGFVYEGGRFVRRDETKG